MSVLALQAAAQLVLDRLEGGGDLEFAKGQLAAALQDLKSREFKAHVIQTTESQWLARAKSQDYGKPSSMGYKRKELEYFVGAMEMLNKLLPDEDPTKLSRMVPPYWVINAMIGSNIVKVPDGR